MSILPKADEYHRRLIRTIAAPGLYTLYEADMTITSQPELGPKREQLFPVVKLAKYVQA